VTSLRVEGKPKNIDCIDETTSYKVLPLGNDCLSVNSVGFLTCYRGLNDKPTHELLVCVGVVKPLGKQYANTLKKYTYTLLEASKKVGLVLNAEIIKYWYV
jgi:hypothetical protein